MPLTPASVAAHLAVVGWILLLPALSARLGHRRSAALVVATLLAAVLLVPAPAGLPVSSMVELREGRERELLEALWGTEPWFGRWMPRTIVPFRAAIWLHRLQAVLASGLFAGLAWGAVGALGAVVLTSGFVTTAWFVHGAASNGPELPLTIAALVAAQAATLRSHPRALVRVTAIGVTVAVAVACAGLRPETVLVTVPTALWAAIPAHRLPSWRPRGWGPILAIVGSSVCLAVLGAVVQYTSGHRGASERGAFPWSLEHLQTLRLPLDLLGFGSPGFALLALGGLIVIATRSLAGAAWVAGVLTLARLYALEGHLGAAPFETLRHGAMMQGWVGLGALGAGVALRGLGPRGRPVWIGLAALTLVPRLLPPEGIPAGLSARIETTQQVGARFLLETAEAFPRCVLASRVAAAVVDRTGPQSGWTYRWTTVYHGAAGGPMPLTEDPGAVAALLEHRHRAEPPSLALPTGWPAALASAPCVVAIRGVDCALNGADCDAWVAAAAPEVDVDVVATEHNTHHGGHAQPLRLAAWPFRRAATPTAAR